MTYLLVVQSKIYELRGLKVMLDCDLAALYRVETGMLNQAVKRNIMQFPEEFMFQLSIREWKEMSSQFERASLSKRSKTAMPYINNE